MREAEVAAREEEELQKVHQQQVAQLTAEKEALHRSRREHVAKLPKVWRPSFILLLYF